MLGGLQRPADLFVHSLPGIPNLSTHPTHPLQIYAGNLPSYPGEGQGGGEGATGVDAYLFFMMIRARRSAGKQRVILWFNGGPGCSSFDGSLMEVGPFRTVSAAKSASGQVEVELVEGGWEEYATIVFIDQPPGTGLSFVPTNGYLHDLGQGAQHLIQFLQNFYSIFPELSGVDTYLAGESFAGQYIPYFASALIKTNVLPGFKLAGLAIGNGWIDPFEQYPAYAEFGYTKGLVQKDSSYGQELDKRLKSCLQAIESYKGDGMYPVNIGECGGMMGAVGDPFITETNGRTTCLNVYDVRLTDDYPACGMNWPPDLGDVYTFLRRSDVISALHATRKETAWVECDGRVSSELTMYNSPASVKLLPEILEAGVPILMFAGAEDLICNYVGIERICDKIEWSGEKGMGNSTTEDWYFNGTQVGTWRTHRNLSYAKVFDSSHMVGFDVPHVTNDMITRFMEIDFSLVPGIEASSKSRVGSNDRFRLGPAANPAAGMPLLKGGNTDWEAAYNVGSATMILLILLSIVGLYFYFRRRARLRYRLNLSGEDGDVDAAERVPLGVMDRDEDGMSSPRRKHHHGHGHVRGKGSKGKGRAKGFGSDGGGSGRYSPAPNGNGSASGVASPGLRDSRELLPSSPGREEVVFALGEEDEEDRDRERRH